MKKSILQKGLSFAMVCIFMLTSASVLFSGCSSKSKYMQSGEWLYLINQKFGFSYLLDGESYETAVSPNDSYYDDVQLAYAYGVLPSEYAITKTDNSITNEFCALTLAGAIYTPNENEINIADIGKSAYADKIITVTNEGIMPLNDKDEFKPTKKTLYEDAVEYLDKAYNSWAHHHYDTVVDFKVRDNVVDLNGISTYTPYEETRTVINENIMDDSGNYASETRTVTDYKTDEKHEADSRKWLDDNHFVYDKDSGTVTLDNISDKNITDGSILALPGTVDSVSGTYLKVTSVEQENGRYKLSVVPAETEEVFGDDFHIAQGTELDLGQAAVYGPDGELLSAGKFAGETSTATSMSYGNAVGYSQINGNTTIPIKLGNGCEINVKLSGSDLTVDLKKSLYKSTEDKALAAKNYVTEASLSYSKKFSGLTVETNYKAWDYAKVALNYKTTDSLSFKATSNKYLAKDVSGKELIDELMRSPETAEKINTFKICEVKVPIKIGEVVFTIYGKISVEGSVVISLVYSGCSTGVEARGGHVNMINDKGVLSSKSVTGSAKLEAGPALNIAYCLINNDKIIDLEFWLAVGVTASAKLTKTYTDTEGKERPHDRHYEIPSSQAAKISSNLAPYLVTDAAIDATTDLGHILFDPDENSDADIDYLFCADLTAYLKIEFSAITSNCRLSKDSKKWFHGNFPKYSATFGGPDVPEWRIVRFHGESCSEMPFDFGKNKCSLSDPKSEGVEYGDDLDILPNGEIILKQGESAEVKITMLPETKSKYYLLDDLTIASEDAGIASARLSYIKDRHLLKIFSDISNFISKSILKINDKQVNDTSPKIIITAADKPGKTRVTLKTNDNTHKKDITVIVLPKDVDENDYMSLSLSSFAAPVQIGASAKVDVVNIPESKTENDIYWESDDTSIAAVDPFTGEITGISEGYCTVKAYIIGYEKSAVEIAVSVSPAYAASGTGTSATKMPRKWIKVEGLPIIILEDT